MVKAVGPMEKPESYKIIDDESWENRTTLIQLSLPDFANQKYFEATVILMDFGKNNKEFREEVWKMIEIMTCYEGIK